MRAILYPILIILLFWNCKEATHNAGRVPVKDSTQSKGVSKTDSSHQKADTSLNKADTSPKYIYITFDDGPLKGSDDINDAVRNEQVKVNVFVVGQHALSSKLKDFYEMYQNNPYIEIGNHSFSHAHNHY